MCNTLTRQQFSASVVATTVAHAGCTESGRTDATGTGSVPVCGDTENLDGTAQSGEIESTTELETVTTGTATNSSSARSRAGDLTHGPAVVSLNPAVVSPKTQR